MPSQPTSGTPICPVCAATNVRQVRPGDITSVADISFSYTFSPEHCRTLPVYRCAACSHMFCWPVPETISSNYADVVDDEYLRHHESRELSAEICLDTIRRYKPAGQLLDVGCATGDFLSSARARGYEVAGIELSHWSASIARGRGLTIYEEPAAVLGQQLPHAFDVVSLWGVIEHFSRPSEEMRHLASLLRPDGLLAVWTGDVDSITSRVLGRRWWYWQGQHIQYFTRRSLMRLVQDAGLEIAYVGLYPFGATRGTITNSLRRYLVRPLLQPGIDLAFRLRRTWYLRLPGEVFLLARCPTQVAPVRVAEVRP